MYYEIQKSWKKIAHTVMDKGLENHYSPEQILNIIARFQDS